jgi:hypothetical protein
MSLWSTSLVSALSRVLAAAGVGLLVLAPLDAALGAVSASSAPSGTTWAGTTWVTHPLPPAPGTGLTRNEDGEPGMGVTPTGQFWTASDIAPYAAHDPRVDPVAGLLSGADIWTSTDGGRTYRWVSDPFAASENTAGLAGEDTDLTVAPEKNSKGFYTVYAASLWIGSSSLAWSDDGGKNWSVNPLGGVPAQDRPWLAADGPCTVYVTYHQLPAFTPTVSAYDVCSSGNVPIKNGAALDPVNQTALTASDLPGLSNSFNKQVVDTSPTSKFRHRLYIPMSLCQVQSPIVPDLLNNVTASSGCPTGTQYLVAVSDDGGQTFSYHPVVLDPSGATLVWAATVATDAAGTVYFTWSDNKGSYLDSSTDGGTTWSKPKQLNLAGSTAVYPTVAAGNAGRVDVAWYGTDRAGNANDIKAMGKPSLKGGALWRVNVARSTDAGKTFAVRTVSDTIHIGELCTSGGGCASDGSRNLLDDFGLAISPTTGLDSAVFTDDQPQGAAGTAFTAYTSEVAPVKAAPKTQHRSTSRATTTSAGGSRLAATGGSWQLPALGLAAIAAAALLRRRRRA